jgi:alcohol dehydrogenase
MKAAVLYKHGGPGTIVVDENFPDPVPGTNDVIVQVKATSLNYHDIFTRRGMPGLKIPMPCVMGIDFAGDIIDVGKEVTDWRAGDRVLIDPIDRVNLGGLIGEMWHGGLAQYCRVPTHHLVRLPDDVKYENAAALPVAYGTALRMISTNGEVKGGDKVLILGASGGVGTCSVLLAKMLGATVIACAGNSRKMEELRRIGADHVINYKEHDFVQEIYRLYTKPHRRKLTGGVDVVVNFTGGETWVPSLKVLRRGGKLLTCGATAGFDPREDIRYIWTFELRIIGSNGWMREDVQRLLELTESGHLRPIIDRVLPLDQVNEAFRMLEEREVFGKVIVKP